MKEKSAGKRRIKNSELEKHLHHILDPGGHINGQGRYPVEQMYFGNVRAGFASCEIIAIYNVLKDLDRHVPLSELIYQDEKAGFMLAGGFFGTKIYKIGDLLAHFDIRYKKIKRKDFQKAELEQKIPDETIFIVTIKNRRDLPVCGLHTFEMLKRRNQWYVYNRFNNSECAGIYDNLDSILKNGPHYGSLYAVYEILREKEAKE